MKTRMKTLQTRTVQDGSRCDGAASKQVALCASSDDTFAVHVVVEGRVVDEERFTDLFDAQEYADELRRSIGGTELRGAAGRLDQRYLTVRNLVIGCACIEAVSTAIGQGRAEEVFKALKTAGLL
jgi:hypothetical protein